MKKTLVLSLIFFIISITNLGADDKEKWVKILPDAKEMQQISLKALPEAQQRVPIKVAVPGLMVKELMEKDMLYQQVAIPGAGVSAEVGSPDLPKMRRFVKIPPGARPFIKNLTSKSQIIKDYQVYPVQEPWAEFYKAEKPKFQRDERIYSKDAFFPEQIVKLGEPAIFRGLQVVPVEITPVQYNPVKKLLKVHSNIEWKLGYQGGVDNTQQEDAEAGYTEHFAPIFEKSILNYKLPTEKMINKWKLWPFLKIDYLIITHDNFYSSIMPLANSKTARGLKVKVVKTSEIKSGGPSAADITNYIKNIYKRTFPRLSYVLLVGDVEYVPTHYGCSHPSSSEQSKAIGTDLYYATMDADVTKKDYIPDLALGRLPGATEKEITIMVNKILEYEKSRIARECWFNNVLFAAYFEDVDKNGITERWFLQTAEEIRQYLKSINYRCATIYTQTPGSPATKFYKDGITPVPSTVLFDGSSQAVINGIDHGVFLVIHRDHGDSRNGPYGGSDGWGNPGFVSSDVAKLDNKREYPIFYSINCRSGWFDGETDKDAGTTKVECLGETLLKQDNAGASGFIGSTRISYSGYNDEFSKGLIDSIWPGFNRGYTISGSNHLGYILNYAKIYMAEYYGYPEATTNKYSLVEFEEFNLLGDPEMMIKKDFFLLKKYPLVIPYTVKPYKILTELELRTLQINPKIKPIDDR